MSESAEERFLARLDQRRPAPRRPELEYAEPALHPKDLYDPTWTASREGILRVRRILKAERAVLNTAIQAVSRGGTRVLPSHETEKLARWVENFRWIDTTLNDLRTTFADLDAVMDVKMLNFSRQFVWHAKRTLDPATFEAIAKKAEDGVAAQEARRKLGVGSAVEVKGSAAPMRERP